ncbi:UNKNOWN [Stylonychia lemnae]|uniref:Uncharacterized protein n=1 Tax=Stylonychia lemnae TaxID=5949 RepID=A0A077ZVY0_STYLE|nr:UNKNOWN [Stylonychia lemnae]|eukprot:CDW72596.1 UNKNOWN [Stylonychia lemnae]
MMQSKQAKKQENSGEHVNQNYQTGINELLMTASNSQTPQKFNPNVYGIFDSNQSPMSEGLDVELLKKFDSFKQIDQLVQQDKVLRSGRSIQTLNRNLLYKKKIWARNRETVNNRQNKTVVKFIMTPKLLVIIRTKIQQSEQNNLIYKNSISSNDPFQSKSFQKILRNQKESNGSIYGNIMKPSQVTDRLITIGILYQAKKSKLKEEQDKKIANAEDNIVNQIKRKHSKENLHSFRKDPSQSELNVNQNQPVEQRLFNLKRKYDQNVAQRQKQKEIQEISELKNPMINSKSQKLLEKQSYLNTKVEDRLLEVGKKWKDKKEQQLKEYIEEMESRAYPVLTINQSQVQQSQQQKSATKQKSDLKNNFFERLKKQMEKKEKMLEKLKNQFDEEQIIKFQKENQISKKEAESRLKEFDQRLQKYENLKENNKTKIMTREQSKCTFIPQINEYSKRLLTTSASRERLRDVQTPRKNHHSKCKTDRFSKSPHTSRSMHQTNTQSQDYLDSRLSNQNKQQTEQSNRSIRSRSKTPQSINQSKQDEIFSFHPVINEKSRQMAERLILGYQQQRQHSNQRNEDGDENQYDTTVNNNSALEPRWSHLYRKHFEIQQKQHQVKEQLKEYQEYQDSQECTFKPDISETSWVYQNIGQMGEVQERNYIWHENRNQKLKQLNKLFKQEELEDCTFHPQTIAIQADYSQLNTKAIEKFLERCNYAKQLKYEQELKEEQRFGSGRKWKNCITVPKAPNFVVDYFEKQRQKDPSPIKSELSQTRLVERQNLYKEVTPTRKQLLYDKNRSNRSQNNNQDIQLSNQNQNHLDNLHHLMNQQQQQLNEQADTSNNMNNGNPNQQFNQNYGQINEVNNNFLYTIQEADVENSKITTYAQNTRRIGDYTNKNTLEKQRPTDGQYEKDMHLTNIFDYQNSLQETQAPIQRVADGGEGTQYQNALEFLHEQLHKIEFSFDQQQQD